MKIVIVMTYCDRQFQLNKTLRSFIHSNHKDFEVVVVDDSKKKILRLKQYPFKVTNLATYNKKWSNPEPVSNIGIYYALLQKPNFVILQNAENYHVGDLISYVANMQKNEYVSFACYGIDRENTFRKHSIDKIIEKDNHGAIVNDRNAWYNHSIHSPRGLDWCSAISAKNLIRLNGYDERLSDGCWYGDDYFLYRVKLLGLDFKIIDYPFVVHQWHNRDMFPMNHAELVEKNRLLYNELLKEKNLAAVHKYSQGFENFIN